MSKRTRLEANIEYHDGDPVCVGQWCCGCDEHPIGKPWGWNYEAWERHYAESHSVLGEGHA